MDFNLKKVLKALLFTTSQPLSANDIQAAFTRFHEQQAPGEGAEEPLAPGAQPEESAEAETAAMPADADLYQDVPALITNAQIRETMDEIATEMRTADEGLLLIEGSNGYRLATHPRFARWVRLLRNEPMPLKLTQTAMETLAIIAYRQPVTRSELEAIRGVSAEAGLNRLLERDLIYIVGRADLPGRPIQYGTTDQFLEYVGLKSLDELPSSDVLSARQIDDWLQKAMNPVTLSDAEMGLPQENLPLDAPGPDPFAAEDAPHGASERETTA